MSGFWLRKRDGKSDKIIIAELERAALELLGPWNKKKYDSFVSICCHQGQINPCLQEMGVSYEAGPVPSGPQKRFRTHGNVGSELPIGKKSKDKATTEVTNSSATYPQSKATKKSSVKQSASSAVIHKRVAASEVAGSQKIPAGDPGTPAFIREVKKN